MNQMFSRRHLALLGAFSLFLGASMQVVHAEDFNDDPTLNEFPKRPTPAWVQMVDQGEQDNRLTGLQTPAGIRVEIVAEEPVVIDPVGMTFAEDGTPHVLEWRVAEHPRHLQYEVQFQDGTTAMVNRMEKEVRDELKLLHDDDGDGNYDRSSVLLDDLEIPSSLLLHDDWIYLSSLGRVTRRRQSQPGGAYDIEEEIVRGLCGFHHHQASGLTLSHDGWLYITSGDDDNRGEGSDGSRATVLRCGAIMRCRPDGSQLTEFARGFRNPYRDVSFDHMFNMLHVDNDQEDGSKFQGCRLMHVQEGADYGWRLKQGTLCCRTDFERGAVFGEAPGRMPSMLKTGRGAPAGLLIYQGTRFPEFFRGLLIYPDVYRKLVRAYRVERAGSTFKVVEEFVLMQSDDPLFRPCQAVLGPDGAIYIVDWRTDSGGAGRLFGDGEHGRIYRLTWSGIEGAPAIERGTNDAWAQVATMTTGELLRLLDTEDFALRTHVQRALIKRGAAVREPFLAVALDQSRTAPARAMALGGACYFYDDSVVAAMRDLLDDKNFELRRLAADALGRHTTGTSISPEVISRLAQSLQDEHPAVRRSAAMALGRVASLLDDDHPERQRAAARLYDALRHDDGQDVYLHDGLLRGLEHTAAAGMDLLVAAALGDHADDRAFAIAELRALRTRPAVDALNRVLQDSDKLTDRQVILVLETYGQILLEPPIDASEVGNWLRGHPNANVELKLAAVATLALTGTTNPEVMLPFVQELIDHPVQQFRLAVIALIGDMNLLDASPALARALRDTKRGLGERRAIVAVLARLRQEDLPWENKSPPGVERVVDELAALALDKSTGALRGDLIEVLAAVAFERTQPIAEAMLEDDDAEVVRSAVRALGADRQQALNLGKRFVAGQLDRDLLPAVAAALEKHVESEGSGEVKSLLTEVFRGGLLLSLEPEEVARVEKLVATTGDAESGRRVYLDSQKSQCAKCHQLEGVGAQVGPDLTKIWDTHSGNRSQGGVLIFGFAGARY